MGPNPLLPLRIYETFAALMADADLRHGTRPHQVIPEEMELSPRTAAPLPPTWLIAYDPLSNSPTGCPYLRSFQALLCPISRLHATTPMQHDQFPPIDALPFFPNHDADAQLLTIAPLFRASYMRSLARAMDALMRPFLHHAPPTYMALAFPPLTYMHA